MLRPKSNSMRMVLCLDGIWTLKVNNEERPIAVPGSWNEQYQDLCYEEGPLVYSTDFFVPEKFVDKHIRLYFGAVNTDCVIFINGEKVKENHIGYLPFEVDITGKVRKGKNELKVVVENHLKMGGFPSKIPEEGTHTVGFLGSFPAANFDFFPYGGIIRPVMMEFTEHSRIVDVWVDTSESNMEEKLGKVKVKVMVSEEAMGEEMKITFGGIEKKVKLINTHLEEEFTLRDVKFWSPKVPHLYPLKLEIMEKDEYELEIGIRVISWDEKRLYLNGKPIFLKGFGKHEEFPVLGQGTFYPLMVKDFNLLKWINANSFRTSHYPYSEEWLDLADRLGVLVIDEAPHVGITRHHYNTKTQNLAVENLKRIIDRDKNHPSVIMWSVANEPESNYPEADKFFKMLYKTAKNLDRTRPVVMVSMMDTPDERTRDVALRHFDIICVNRYYGWYVHQGRIEEGLKALEKDLDELYKRHKKPIFITEFGADAIAGFHYDPPQMFSEEYQAELIKKTVELLMRKDYIIGAHPWAFADFKTPQNVRRPILNHKGVFTRDRQPKLSAHVLRKLWSNS
ncbi:glycoside hydrolase family 2 TIM barrel-domain containing protein [Thermotoga sp. KOL6]|uniref:glycoside hydrolase family 2 TIM barrel-domain containing protein n=1 Tax=Thermotoga sp. KOL6 TaxID=126741 RepID=UPI000C786314|nr:glycoside hydrolase family 2 TIM barrel-domain containing protein [Thermotoga sp. KOL6]PLV59810.1 beta-glucuronidase [Thermotoga sp. KOL6]